MSGKPNVASSVQPIHTEPTVILRNAETLYLKATNSDERRSVILYLLFTLLRNVTEQYRSVATATTRLKLLAHTRSANVSTAVQ
jgi:hypothetical protein